MTTTVSVSPKGQMDLPEEFRRRRRIRPGAALRVTEVGDGLYVAPLPEPSEKELREVIAAVGSLTRAETPEDEAMVQRVIADYRREKRQKRG
jgi:AbrB family looped-hinge helix DNA binding protein